MVTRQKVIFTLSLETKLKEENSQTECWEQPWNFSWSNFSLNIQVKNVESCFSFPLVLSLRGPVAGGHSLWSRLVAQSSLLQPQAKVLHGESRGPREGQKGHILRSPSPPQVLRTLLSLLVLSTFPLTINNRSPGMQEERKAKQRQIGSPRPGRGPGEVPQLIPPGSDKRGPNHC